MMLVTVVMAAMLATLAVLGMVVLGHAESVLEDTSASSYQRFAAQQSNLADPEGYKRAHPIQSPGDAGGAAAGDSGAAASSGDGATGGNGPGTGDGCGPK